MSLPLRQPSKRKAIPKVRTKPRRTLAIKCRPHVNWVLATYQCALAGKVSKHTGKTHECTGRLDPHHTPTRGAGGGDNNVCPLCRGAHTQIDSPGHSERSVQDEYGADFRATAAELWDVSPPARRYRLQTASLGHKAVP